MSNPTMDRARERANRHVSLTYGTAAGLVLFALAISLVFLIFIWSLYGRVHTIQSQSDCRASVAEEERHATLDLLVATGKLFIDVGQDPSAKAQAILHYQQAVDRAEQINGLDVEKECQ